MRSCKTPQHTTPIQRRQRTWDLLTMQQQSETTLQMSNWLTNQAECSRKSAHKILEFSGYKCRHKVATKRWPRTQHKRARKSIAKQANLWDKPNANTNGSSEDCEQSYCSEKTNSLCGGHITGAPNTSSDQEQPNPPLWITWRVSSITLHPSRDSSEKAQNLKSKETFIDAKNIEQKSSKT